ncbi:MAG: ATP-dependent helicase [Agitococcus sp.]|nr:ATP-dependent helicase [Agitococcus sp.]MDO9177022.1 ATP-dependent helicase [Agitococcus sp.]
MAKMDYGCLFAALSSESEAPLLVSEGVALSKEQQCALDSPFEENATICAGAGAGKTKLLVERVVKLVQAGVNPKHIAVVTFTKKSAIEIGARIQRRFLGKKTFPICSTVHALALAGLMKNKEEIHLINEESTETILATLRLELPSELGTLPSSELLLELNRCREEEQFDGLKGLAALRFGELMDEQGVCDFTSLLYRAILKSKSKFKYILVDESQDLSKLQLTYLKSIGTPRTSFYWYIGDPDQAIYAFRGANQGVMQSLQAHCSAHFVLSTNYRSAARIVKHANNVIQANEDRLPIVWTAHNLAQGDISVNHYETSNDELRAVRDWLREHPNRMALARTQALVAILKEEGLAASTVHEAKGLEWDEVWILGCENGLFPHPLNNREEERRLFYVAMTRAKHSLIMSYCTTRLNVNNRESARNPSIFLYEAQAL